ncbi:hypothetical protein KIN20_010277 [Parelaphostrongylus tenuis]|uniref:Uncharacterized protein n=1 Tax=Parelaphostrongylus tenuis TaxID=148309 RepID=A0AAD5MQC4_PARTN|nr:hypothetical protein KIN20_010277 [Parelaphostrongylus tenuis]
MEQYGYARPLITAQTSKRTLVKSFQEKARLVSGKLKETQRKAHMGGPCSSPTGKNLYTSLPEVTNSFTFVMKTPFHQMASECTSTNLIDA